jgi:hypothetical protein
MPDIRNSLFSTPNATNRILYKYITRSLAEDRPHQSYRATYIPLKWFALDPSCFLARARLSGAISG